MAKLLKRSEAEAESVEVEVTFLRRRKDNPEKFDVMTGVVSGPVRDAKVRDANVSFVVAREVAGNIFEAQKEAELERMKAGK